MGIITLITDFGLQDPYAAMMKGVILTRAPETRIVDLTHEIPAHRPAAAGFWLSCCLPWFPRGTVHVAIVDPGVGTDRRILALSREGQVVLAPDNGLLEPMLPSRDEALGRVSELRAVDLAKLDACLPPYRSSTFHGRDIFAPLAAELAAGRLSFDEMGPPVHDPRRGAPAGAANGDVLGHVLLVDHFGNLISDVQAARIPPGASRVHVDSRHTVPLVARYSDVAPGAALALINAHGVLEIAVNGGRASDRLRAGPGAPLKVDGPSP